MVTSVFTATLLGFLTGLGVGGGSLLILWLTLILDMDPITARGLNLLFFLPASTISCLFRSRQGHLNWRATLPATLSGCAAAVIFSLISANLNTQLLRKLFGILLLATGIRELVYRPKDEPAKSGTYCTLKGGLTMIQSDTIKLLRECDAGVKMGIASIDDVLSHVESEPFQKQLTKCKQDHEKLQDEIQQELDKYQDEGKNPNPIAKGMSWMKTNMKLGMEDSDATIADLMTDGCNMGVKSLSRYLNQYKAADERSKDIAKKLIQQEDQLCRDARAYL